MRPKLRAAVAAAAVLLGCSSAAFAQGADPATRKFGETSTRETTLGTLVDSMDREANISGTLGDGGKLVTKHDMQKDLWEGHWTLPDGDEECEQARDGTKHWGRIWFKLSEFGRVFTGKYGHCGAEPDKDFSAKWSK